MYARKENLDDPYSFHISRIWPQLASSRGEKKKKEGKILIQVSPTLLGGMAAHIFTLESSICLAEAAVVLGAGYLVK